MPLAHSHFYIIPYFFYFLKSLFLKTVLLWNFLLYCTKTSVYFCVVFMYFHPFMANPPKKSWFYYPSGKQKSLILLKQKTYKYGRY